MCVTVATVQWLKSKLGNKRILSIILHLDHQSHGFVLVEEPLIHSALNIETDPARLRSQDHRGVHYHVISLKYRCFKKGLLRYFVIIF